MKLAEIILAAALRGWVVNISVIPEKIMYLRVHVSRDTAETYGRFQAEYEHFVPLQEDFEQLDMEIANVIGMTVVGLGPLPRPHKAEAAQS